MTPKPIFDAADLQEIALRLVDLQRGLSARQNAGALLAQHSYHVAEAVRALRARASATTSREGTGVQALHAGGAMSDAAPTREELDRLMETLRDVIDFGAWPTSLGPDLRRILTLLRAYPLHAVEGERGEQLRSLACEIAGDLFSNSNADVADRLVLERADAKADLGGWSIGGAVGRIEKHLRRAAVLLLQPERRERAQPSPIIVCLCGSTRFYQEFQRANYEETMAGKIVLSVGFYMHAVGETGGHGEGVGADSAEKIALDELHKRKIDLADEVLVVSDSTGYFGDSTASEIAYARAVGRPVRFAVAASEERARSIPAAAVRALPEAE